jgi:uncharacterized membrane protein
MMTNRMKWRLMAALSLLVAAYGFALVSAPDQGAPFLRERLGDLPWAVYAHLGASAMALATGPFQFNTRLRARYLRMHRVMGRVYVTSVVVGGIAGFRLALASQGGLVAHIGFGLLAVLWVTSVVIAFRLIRAGRELEHRRWMIRNFSLTFAAVMLRIYLPMSVAVGIPFAVAYPAIAWLCWVPNLVFAELRLVPARQPEVVST